MAALAITSALYYRNSTGKGQKLDVSLLDTQISMTSYLAAYWLIGGKLSGRQGSRHENVVPYEAFQTSDLWLVVACVTQKFWEGLCKALGLEELIGDDRFSSAVMRLENRDELIPVLQKRFREKSTREWLALLDEEDVPCAPVNTLDLALSDPQVLSRNMIIELDHPQTGTIKLPGNPIKSSESGEFLSPPSLLGEYTREVLRDVLEYADEKIQKLADEKAIGLYKNTDHDG